MVDEGPDDAAWARVCKANPVAQAGKDKAERVDECSADLQSVAREQEGYIPV